MPHMLKQVLGSVLTPEETAQVYSAFDQIGDIVIIKIPDELMPKKKLMLELLSQVKFVAAEGRSASARHISTFGVLSSLDMTWK